MEPEEEENGSVWDLFIVWFFLCSFFWVFWFCFWWIGRVGCSVILLPWLDGGTLQETNERERERER
jgi:hypothetical protein